MNSIYKTTFILLGIITVMLLIPTISAQVRYEDKNEVFTPKNWPKGRPYWDMPAIQDNALSKLFSTQDYVLNPFHQPNLIYDQLNCYGGGDYDGNGIGQGDIDAAQAGIKDDRIDVNGDSQVNNQDANLLQNYKDGNSSKLPSWWNFSNREEKVDWLDKTLAIDQTDTITYRPGEIVSGDFSTILYFHFQGPPKTTLEAKTLIATKYDTTNLGRFNIPLYQVALSTPTGAHGMNAVLVGENPLNFYDWQFIEPQQGEYNHFKNFGSNWNPPIGSIIAIRRFTDISKDSQNNLFIPVENLVKFEIDGSETPILYGDPNPNLLLTEPTVAIDNENPSISQGYSLEQNYPNPFNPITSIQYSLLKTEKVSLKIYNITGHLVDNISIGYMNVGSHLIQYNSVDLSSGTYFYQLSVNSKLSKPMKMTILK